MVITILNTYRIMPNRTTDGKGTTVEGFYSDHKPELSLSQIIGSAMVSYDLLPLIMHTRRLKGSCFSLF